MLLKTSCCHGHCNGCLSSDWLFRWITNARRASLALLMVSSIIIYCIPQTRKPAKKGCHLLIDLVAGGLKIIIGKIDDSEQVKIIEDSKSLLNGIDSAEEIEIVSDSLDNLESSPLYSKTESVFIQKNDIFEDSKQHNVRFIVPENKRKRHKKECLENESDWLKRRKAFCKIHKPCEMKFQEKSVEKVPSPLMQFDTSEHQKLSRDTEVLSNYNSHGHHRKDPRSSEYQNHFELHPHHFSKNDLYNYSELSYFEIDSESLSDMLIDESYDKTPRSSRMPADKENQQFQRLEFNGNSNRLTKTMSWLSDQIHKFERSLKSLSASIDVNVEKLKDINFNESQSIGTSTNSSVTPRRIGTSTNNYLHTTVVKKTSEATQNVSKPEKETDKSVMTEQSTLSRIFDWIFGEEKHSSQTEEKKILNIVKQKLL